jgi:hypothetical protein
MNGDLFCRTLVIVVLSTAVARGQAPSLWGKLTPGPHQVGFKSLWQLDHARRYNMTFSDGTTYATGKAPRPILINVWYPAKPLADARPMVHGDYLDIASTDPILTKFAAALISYDRDVIAKELLRKSEKDLTESGKQLFQQFLDTPTACFRNAPAPAGKFPLVIYHAGHGSSFEDNAVLCEFLASHGYVVMGSAFQESSGKSFNVEGKHTSADDFQFLIRYARTLANVDCEHLGIVGHSGGAHAAITYRTQQSCFADAIVSLDTTQDYYGVSDLRWENMTTSVAQNRLHMTGPLLMVANPHAFFEMADSITPARRYYFTIKALDHNDFISQGKIGRAMRSRLPAAKPAKADQDVKEKAEREAVEQAYEALCNYVLQFLNAELKGDAKAKAYLATQFRTTPLAGDAPHVEYIAPGTTGAEPYAESSSQPPTPRQVRAFLRKHGSDKTIALFKRFRGSQPTAPIFSSTFGLALVGDLLNEGRVQDAIAFRDYYKEFGDDCARLLQGWGDVYLRFGRTALAADNFKKVLLLDPTNKEAAEKLKKASAAEKAADR